jgi:hypothetical protein
VTKRTRKPKDHPTRIHQLAGERGWTYGELAARISALAAKRGDTAHAKVHEITIHRLAAGKTKLSREWESRFAEVFGVPPEQITSPTPVKTLIRVPVAMTFEGNSWRTTNEIPEAEREDAVLQLSNTDSRAKRFYAGEIRGEASNRRWRPGTTIILSHLEHTPGEIAVGKRYHVRVTRADGLIEDSIRQLVQEDDSYWLKHESDKPEFRKAVQLPSEGVELVGLVRWSMTPE